MCPSDGSFVVGPIEPATKRGCAAVEYACGNVFAISAARRFSSYAWSARPYSASTMDVEPNESVSMTSHPLVEIVVVHPLDSGRFREHKIFVAAVQVFSPEIVGGEILALEMRSGRAVEHDDLLAHHFQKCTLLIQ